MTLQEMNSALHSWRRAGPLGESPFDGVVLQGLRPLSVGLVVIYLLLAGLNSLILPRDAALVVGITNVVLAGVFLALYTALRHERIPARWAHPTGMAIAVLAVFSVLLRFVLAPYPFDAAFVLLILIGCGLFMLSIPWLILAITFSLVAWGAAAWSPLPRQDFLLFSLPLLAAAAVAVAIAVARRRALRMVEQALRSARETETSLRESEARLELAIEGSKGGWWEIVMDPEAPQAVPDEIHLSPSSKALIGYQDHDFPNSQSAWREQIYPADLTELQESSFNHLMGLTPQHEAEYRIRHKNGDLRWIYVRGRIQRDSDGRPLRWSGVNWDITDKKTADERLHQLFQAVEQSPSIVIITDSDGNIEYVNPKFSRVTGYSADEVIGENPRILKQSDTPPDVHEELWRTISAGGEWQGEFKNQKKDGEPYWVLASISPIINSEGVTTHYLGVQEDITERKKVEAQLMQSQRMESLGLLVSGVAHDFNNLMTAVIGFADLALNKTPQDDQKRADLTEIKRAGETASWLTRQLLAFSRQQVLEPRVLDLNQVVGQTAQLLRHVLGDGIEMVIRQQPELWNVRCDPGQLEQVLMNLAVNSRDAMPGGGRVTLETANVEIDEAYASSHASAEPGPYVTLTVTDTGCGMDRDTQVRVFEPFFTTKQRGQGTGLGLSTVYGIVKQSGGYIWVYSEPDRGTTFKIHLPRVREVAELAGESEPFVSPTTGDERILLVDDDDSVRRLATRILEDEGYRVLAAENPEQALRMWKGLDGTLDLLLTDVSMPGMSGFSLAKAIASQGRRIKVLYLSGHSRHSMAYADLDLESSVLAKPFSRDSLVRKVREVLEAE